MADFRILEEVLIMQDSLLRTHTDTHEHTRTHTDTHVRAYNVTIYILSITIKKQ